MSKLWTKLRSLGRGTAASQKIFILGSGRSGTHWIGHVLQAHPDVSVKIEERFIFSLVTRTSLDLRRKTWTVPLIRAYYRIRHAMVAPRHYADKTHPNIWLAEDLAAAFPNALFLGIQRNPYATVASMLNHPGVLRWHREWRTFPVPNPFLGITKENEGNYDALPLAARCALRWRSHAEQMERLKEALGGRLYVASYERLITETGAVLKEVEEFLGLATPLPIPRVKSESLDRWKSELAADVISDIASTLGDRWVEAYREFQRSGALADLVSGVREDSENQTL